MANKRIPTEHEAAVAAYQTLKDEGLLPPQSADEVANLEEEFGRYPKSKLSAAAALKFAKEHATLPAIKAPAPFAELSGTINYELGVAARKGSDIPAEVWTKMKADRRKAQEEHGKQRD